MLMLKNDQRYFENLIVNFEQVNADWDMIRDIFSCNSNNKEINLNLTMSRNFSWNDIVYSHVSISFGLNI